MSILLAAARRASRFAITTSSGQDCETRQDIESVYLQVGEIMATEVPEVVQSRWNEAFARIQRICEALILAVCFRNGY